MVRGFFFLPSSYQLHLLLNSPRSPRRTTATGAQPHPHTPQIAEIKKMSYRWSFNSLEWDPTVRELARISSIIQPEEKSRIARFFFIKDAKSSLIGRLLIRKLINIKTGVPNNLIQLARDEHNKPILISPNLKDKRVSPPSATPPTPPSSSSEEATKGGEDAGAETTPTTHLPADSNLNFNVSHQGSYVVLASDPSASLIGIDIMNIVKPGRITNNVDEYFRMMNRQFTPNEWSQIRSDYGTSDTQQLTNFTRFWSLKEAYVKAIGVGIVIDLRTIDFNCKSELEERGSAGGVGGGNLVTDTQIKINGHLDSSWTFEERFLDNQHIVAVAKQNLPSNINSIPIPNFEKVNLDFLLENMSPLGQEDLDWVTSFLNKK